MNKHIDRLGRGFIRLLSITVMTLFVVTMIVELLMLTADHPKIIGGIFFVIGAFVASYLLGID